MATRLVGFSVSDYLWVPFCENEERERVRAPTFFMRMRTVAPTHGHMIMYNFVAVSKASEWPMVRRGRRRRRRYWSNRYSGENISLLILTEGNPEVITHTKTYTKINSSGSNIPDNYTCYFCYPEPNWVCPFLCAFIIVLPRTFPHDHVGVSVLPSQWLKVQPSPAEKTLEVLEQEVLNSCENIHTQC